MNEEEKKAIELLKNIKNSSWTTKYIMSSDSKNAEILLNLIEKLQKENKELKFEERRRTIGKYGDIEIHDLINRVLSNDYIPVQKIKDKMEKDIKTNEHTIFGGRRNKKTLECGKRLGRIEMCQELLESEE